jgi:hypothetical protein
MPVSGACQGDWVASETTELERHYTAFAAEPMIAPDALRLTSPILARNRLYWYASAAATSGSTVAAPFRERLEVGWVGSVS